MTASKIIAFILRRLNLKLLDLIAKINNIVIYKKLFNILSFFLMYKIKIVSIENNVIYLIEKKSAKVLSICYKNRINYYINGINFRLNHLANEYFINKINLSNNNIVFDIGANIGEVGVYINNRFNNEIAYHAFEPSIDEYKVCIKNNEKWNDNISNIGLWNKPGKMKLYEKNITGDSSLLEIEDYVGFTKIEVDTIDSYVNRHNIKNIKILKIEAEGGEPEVLQGAINTLPIIEYITADLGYERGYEKKQTLTTVTNFLLLNGFEMVDINQQRLTVLFKNKLLFNS